MNLRLSLGSELEQVSVAEYEFLNIDAERDRPSISARLADPMDGRARYKVPLNSFKKAVSLLLASLIYSGSGYIFMRMYRA